MSYKTIAHGPTVPPGRDTAGRRTVLREYRNNHGMEYVVHYEFFYSDGSSGYGNGDYFVPSAYHLEWTLGRAWKRFVERCQRDLESIHELQARQGAGVLPGGEEGLRADL